MDEVEFQCWLARSNSLTDSQKGTAVSVFKSGHQTDIYKILENMRPGRLCPHCNSTDCIKRGKVQNLQRYQCKDCKKTYNILTGTSFSRLRHKELWLGYSSELIEGSSVRLVAKRAEISKNTAFLWRHRFLRAPSLIQAQEFTGITEADETYFLESLKGQRNLPRPARRRGGRARKRGLSEEQVPVLVVRDRSGATLNTVFSSPSNKLHISNALSGKLAKDAVLCTDSSKSLEAFAIAENVCHRKLNSKQGVRVIEQVFHIQNVNAYDSGLKRWMVRFKGVATRYLHHYLGWFRMKDRVGNLLNPHRCLVETVVGVALAHT